MAIDFKKYVPITLEKISYYRDVIERENMCITCINPNKLTIVIPSSEIDILFKEDVINNEIFKNMKFYITHLASKIIEPIIKTTDESAVIKYEMIADTKVFYNFFTSCKASLDKVMLNEQSLLEHIIKKSPKDRLDSLKRDLNELIGEKKHHKLTLVSARKIGHLLTELSFIARLNMLYHFYVIKNNKTPKMGEYINISDMKDITDDIFSTIITLIKKGYEMPDIFGNLDNFIDSNVIAHTNRVFIMFIEFLFFYNEEFAKGLASKVRIEFQDKYLNYYRNIFQNYGSERYIESIENVYKLGMRKLSFKEIINFATGVFWHDITRSKELDYLAVKDVYDIDSEMHAVKAYYLIKYSSKYKQEISFIVGSHHEYYDYGYGIYRNIREAVLKEKPDFQIKYIMSYDYEDIRNMETFSYFPSKVLEIIDVYDILRFSSKKYGIGELNAVNSVLYMRKEFIENGVKLDPILFNIFIKFLKEVKGINSSISII